MNTRAKIKVIKKGAVKIVETPVVAGKKKEPNKTSQLASTVSDWISEFKHQRRQEMELAIERFNSDLPEMKTVFTKN